MKKGIFSFWFDLGAFEWKSCGPQKKEGYTVPYLNLLFFRFRFYLRDAFDHSHMASVDAMPSIKLN